MIKKLLCILLFGSLPAALFGQKSIKNDLAGIKNISVKEISNPDFKECYEISVEQPLDHFHKSGPLFKQQVIIGINDSKAPVVMFTEGYALGKVTKPEFIKDCNAVYVEHRFFGRSKPDSLDWNFLTIKQAVSDLHHVRVLLSEIFKGKWLTMGASKSGQTAIAYKMYFPKDADATVAYVTPVKSSLSDERINEHLNFLLKTDCGQKVLDFQKFVLQNKSVMLKEFEKHVQDKKYTFQKNGIQKAFEYCVLEYSFSFFQNCGDCGMIPDTLSEPAKIMEELVSVASPKFYSDVFVSRLEPSFYMFYHELGYYEYDITPFKKWLSDTNYSNSIFSPVYDVHFDNTYLTSINEFITDPKTSRIIFIYGENDPYTGAQPILKSKNCMKMFAKNGCHKSRTEALTEDQRQAVYKQLSQWLKWSVGT